jgi:hypothetical protein
MSISRKYEEGGAYYLRDEMNSFGEYEVINTQQEIIFCTSSDKTFTEVAKESLSTSQQADFEGLVISDSASTGVLPSQFIADLEDGLVNNTGSHGRFCYKLNNPDVDYRTSGSENAAYCSQGASTEVFLDPVTRHQCRLSLDIDLKAGETRYLRQPIDGSFRTIAQGFVQCVDNDLGHPELELVSNPSTCGLENSGTCNYSCIWADEMSCSGSLMPRWGGGLCGGVGSTLFVNDTAVFQSLDATSFSLSSGKQYEGSASMSCKSVGGAAIWVINSSNCDEVDE